ncbi:MAG: hypothetical protein CMF22_10545 [Idiomarinaceae bacterium]|nr:hypothetical protein [Idiomarinaceae bacterium]MBG23879.1 hypothetical protein [Idiomarinaceae bacterium]|tara:strand:- start:4497 stop:4721 length:225 start_codon:yes stop_codon:yes gene_type:complete
MITVNQMIEILQESVRDDPSVGELPLYVYADQGQVNIQASEPSYAFVHDYDYYIEDFEADKSEEYPKEIIIIGD